MGDSPPVGESCFAPSRLACSRPDWTCQKRLFFLIFLFFSFGLPDCRNHGDFFPPFLSRFRNKGGDRIFLFPYIDTQTYGACEEHICIYLCMPLCERIHIYVDSVYMHILRGASAISIYLVDALSGRRCHPSIAPRDSSLPQ